MKRYLILLYFLLIFSHYGGISQTLPPCDSTYKGLSYYSYNLNTFCPLTTDMGLDVMIGYILLDSICLHGNAYQIYQFADRKKQLDDSVLYIMKYFYKIMDYNPVLFSQNTAGYKMNYPFKVTPSQLIRYIDKIVDSSSDNKKLDDAILFSDYIFHISVNNVYSSAPNYFNRTWSFVDCSILDTIKGKVYPISNQNNSIIKDKDLKRLNSNLEISPPGILFQYCPQWNRGPWLDVDDGMGPYVVDSLGNSWVKPGEEYIVILLSASLCIDSIGFTKCIYPCSLGTMTYCMFPVKNDGTVYDPGNDFGFGGPLSVNEFKQAIRQRINFIINR